MTTLERYLQTPLLLRNLASVFSPLAASTIIISSSHCKDPTCSCLGPNNEPSVEAHIHLQSSRDSTRLSHYTLINDYVQATPHDLTGHTGYPPHPVSCSLLEQWTKSLFSQPVFPFWPRTSKGHDDAAARLIGATSRPCSRYHLSCCLCCAERLHGGVLTSTSTSTFHVLLCVGELASDDTFETSSLDGENHSCFTIQPRLTEKTRTGWACCPQFLLSFLPPSRSPKDVTSLCHLQVSQNPPFRMGHSCACGYKLRFLPRSCSFPPWLHELFNGVLGEASYASLI